MKFNLFSTYIAVGIAGGLATLFTTGFIVGDRIRERGLQAKKLKVLDEGMKAIEEMMKKDSASKAEYLLNPQLFGKE